MRSRPTRKNHMEKNNMTASALRGRELVKYLEGEYIHTRTVMVALGLGK